MPPLAASSQAPAPTSNYPVSSRPKHPPRASSVHHHSPFPSTLNHHQHHTSTLSDSPDHTTPLPSTLLPTTSTATFTSITKVSRPSHNYTATRAKLAWQRKMQSHGVWCSGVPGVGLEPGCWLAQRRDPGVIVGRDEAGEDGNNGEIDLDELARRARLLDARYNNTGGVYVQPAPMRRPSQAVRWHTDPINEHAHEHDLDRGRHHAGVLRAGHQNNSSSIGIEYTKSNDASVPGLDSTISSTTRSPSIKGWWDVIKSPFFVVTPISAGSGKTAISPSTYSNDTGQEAQSSPPLPVSKSLPVRLRMPTLPARVSEAGRDGKVPAFVAVVVEGSRLESERLATANAVRAEDRLHSSAPLVTCPTIANTATTFMSASPQPTELKADLNMPDYFSQKPPSDSRPLRPSFARAAQTLPARLGKTLVPATTTTPPRPRNDILSSSFLQAVLSLDAQAKQERKTKVKVKVKRQRRKMFEEDSDDEEWDFKCRGVDGDEGFAECVVNDEGAEIENARERWMVEEQEKAVMEFRQRPTVKELRSGSSGNGVGGGRDDSVGNGGNGRRKLVRWWSSW